MKTRRLVVSLVAAAGMLVGLGGVGGALAQDGAKQPTAAAAPGADVQLELLSAGSGAKRAIRMSAKVGDVSAFSVTQSMEMSMSMGEMAMPSQKMPSMKITTQNRVLEITPEGNYRLESVITDASLEGGADANPMAAQGMRAAMEAMKGTRTLQLMTPSGRTLESVTKAPEGAPPEMAQSTEEASREMQSIAFPEEPIGVGAKWRVTMNMNQQGVRLKQVAEYELVDLKDDQATVRFTLKQSAEPQKFSPPGMPAEADAEIKSWEGTGEGSTTTRISNMGVITGDLSMDMKMKLGMDLGGQKMDMDQTVKMRMKMAEAPVKDIKPAGAEGGRNAKP